MAEGRARAWPLLPSEQVIWQGAPLPGVARSLGWRAATGLCYALALVTAAFAALMYLSGIPAMQPTLLVCGYLLLTAIALGLLPRYLHDPCEYLLTDRRVLWRRGRQVRSMERQGITYARIRWHPSAIGVGNLELVRAVPFGPLLRRQRLQLHDLEAPDVVFARIREAELGSYAGDGEVGLAERLDADEHVVWGGGPDGWLLGWRDVSTAALGLALLVAAGVYGYRLVHLLWRLEQQGLRILSWTWMLLFLVFIVSVVVMLLVAGHLLWRGFWGARALGRATEYILTQRRLLIRRGRTELSLDRRRIVDVADLPSSRGSRNLFLILDGPQGRALEDSGALGPWVPARDSVPPVLYEVRESEAVRKVLLSAWESTA